MTVPKWSELVVAGKLFAVLTQDDRDDRTTIFAAMADAEALTIDKGVIRLDMKDGRSFELTVRELAP